MSREFRSLSFVRRNASRRTAHVVVYRVLVGSRDVGSLGDSIRGIARRTLFFFFSLLYARCLLCFLDSLVSRVLLLTRLYLRLRTRGSTCLLDPANPKCSKQNYSLGYLSCPSPLPAALSSLLTSSQTLLPLFPRFVILLYRTPRVSLGVLRPLLQGLSPVEHAFFLLRSTTFGSSRVLPMPTYNATQQSVADSSVTFICWTDGARK